MRFSDLIAGPLLLLLSLGTIFFIVPGQIGGTSEYGIAPDVFPLTILWLIAALSMLLTVSRCMRYTMLDRQAAMDGRDAVFLAGTTIYLLLVQLLMPYLGFRWTGGILLLALMLIMGELPEHKVRPVIVAIGAPLLLYFVFWNLFNVPLP